MRGAPHSGLSTLIRRISTRRSASICGRPPREQDFQRQYRRKPARCQRMRVSGRMIVMAFRTDGNQRYSWTKNKRSPFVSWTRPRTLRRNTLSWYRSAAFSASSRRFDLNGETNTVRNKHNRAIIAADVRRFGHVINKDGVLGTYTSHQCRIAKRSKRTSRLPRLLPRLGSGWELELRSRTLRLVLGYHFAKASRRKSCIAVHERTSDLSL